MADCKFFEKKFSKICSPKKFSCFKKKIEPKIIFWSNEVYLAIFTPKKCKNPKMGLRNGRLSAGEMIFRPNQPHILKVGHFLRKKIFGHTFTKFGLFWVFSQVIVHENFTIPYRDLAVGAFLARTWCEPS